MQSLSRLEPLAYAALRIVAGALLAVHGAGKLFGAFGLAQQAVGSQVWIGGVIEFAGGLAVAIGLYTRLAAFLCSGLLAVAYFQFHWKLALGGWRWLPQINQGELAALYCFVFFLIATRGAGRWSMDGSRGRA